MKQPQPSVSPIKPDLDAPSPAPRKAAWHRPTVTFVPLRRTAFDPGSPIDGGTSGSNPPPP